MTAKTHQLPVAQLFKNGLESTERKNKLPNEALKLFLKAYGLKEGTDIIHSQFSNTIFKTPYFVVHNTKHREYVISIRGSMSFSDCVTDLAGLSKRIFTEAESMSLEETLPGCTFFHAHEGMIETARQIYKSFCKNSNRLNDGDSFLPNDKTYPIVVTGHSLGGGVASILAFYVKFLLGYKNVQVYAYGPPGGLLCKNSSKASDDFMVSVVLNKDLIPRLGLHQMNRTIKNMTNSLEECSLPKWKIILGKTKFQKTDFDSDGLESLDFSSRRKMIKRESFRYKLKQCDSDVESVRISLTNTLTSEILELFPPGRMVQVTSDHYCAEIPKYCYDEVVIGKSMLSDHLPNVMLSNLLNTELWSKVVKLTDSGTPVRKGSPDDISPNKEVSGLLDEKYEFRFETFPVRLSDFETRISCGCVTKPRVKKYDDILLPVPILNIAVQKMMEKESATFLVNKAYVNEPDLLYESALPTELSDYSFKVKVLQIY